MQLTVPDNYGYVILGSLVAHFAANMVLGYNVMGARKKFNIQVCDVLGCPILHIVITELCTEDVCIDSVLNSV
jgi:hypothetical protein